MNGCIARPRSEPSASWCHLDAALPSSPLRVASDDAPVPDEQPSHHPPQDLLKRHVAGRRPELSSEALSASRGRYKERTGGSAKYRGKDTRGRPGLAPRFVPQSLTINKEAPDPPAGHAVRSAQAAIAIGLG